MSELMDRYRRGGYGALTPEEQDALIDYEDTFNDDNFEEDDDE